MVVHPGGGPRLILRMNGLLHWGAERSHGNVAMSAALGPKRNRANLMEAVDLSEIDLTLCLFLFPAAFLRPPFLRPCEQQA